MSNTISVLHEVSNQIPLFETAGKDSVRTTGSAAEAAACRPPKLGRPRNRYGPFHLSIAATSRLLLPVLGAESRNGFVF